MRIYCLTITALMICLCTSLSSRSQESIVSDINQELLAKYIALAKQNYPRVRGLKAMQDKAHYQVSISQMSWFDMINAGYYYRPENTTGSGTGGAVTPNGQLITSGFLFGATVNLGSLLSRPSAVKAAKADYRASVAASDEYAITLATQVKSLYYDYLAARKQLVVRNLAAQSLKGLLTDAQQKYQSGSITIDAYTASKNAATEADAMALTAEVTYLKSKDALEDIIGAKLETIK